MLYPEWLQTIAKALPFAYMVYGPSKLFVAPSVGLLVNIISLQFMWSVLLGSILVLSYRRGVAYLTVNGG